MRVLGAEGIRVSNRKNAVFGMQLRPLKAAAPTFCVLACFF